jgi:hypothetical protein
MVRVQPPPSMTGGAEGQLMGVRIAMGAREDTYYGTWLLYLFRSERVRNTFDSLD